jgi:hypothetical protein
MNKDGTRIMFLRTPNYSPCGCVAIKLDRRLNTASYQLSVLNPQDYFNRAVARQLARGRLMECPLFVSIPEEATMYDVSEAVMTDIFVNPTLPTRARKSARLWLATNCGDVI